MPGELIRYPFTATGLSDAQAALGATPEAAKRKLTTMGFKGHRGECHSCPVAVYLLAVIDGIERVDVSYGRVRIGRTVVQYTTVEEEEIQRDMTTAVEDFVNWFDNGLLPDLEVPGA